MSIFLQGITEDEFKSIISDCFKQEIQTLIKEQKENPTQKSSILLSRKETAQKLGVSLVTLHAWSNSEKKILPSYLIGTRVRYKLEDIENLLSSPRYKSFQNVK
ncbi:helix-turn-helix domain-containing protein [Flavobacterium gyeonganense]|uniref:Helix-turn-helix domain-containing protein n=1 Tax=Flavobacterium gyeonganense TaxID=1310418 RepID=A0ABV5H8D6_9FLAO|nr:helix-turn-helix domain-containing protein [Flavobacterium gyeonganense]